MSTNAYIRASATVLLCGQAIIMTEVLPVRFLIYRGILIVQTSIIQNTNFFKVFLKSKPHDIDIFSPLINQSLNNSKKI